MPIVSSPSSSRWTGLSLRGITEFTDEFTTAAADISGVLTSDTRAQWARRTSASFPLAVTTAGQLANAQSQDIIYTFDKEYNSGSISMAFSLTNCCNNAIYLRYIDNNNWLRVVLTNAAGSFYNVCGLQFNGTGSYSDYDGDCYGISSSANPATENEIKCGSPVTTTYNSWSYRPDCYSSTPWSLVAYTYYSYSEVNYTAYPLSYTLSLQQCVAGSVTTISSGQAQALAYNSGYPSTNSHTISVSFTPAQVSYGVSGANVNISTITTATTTHNSSYKFGIGRTSLSSYHTNTSTESVSVVSA